MAKMLTNNTLSYITMQLILQKYNPYAGITTTTTQILP